MNTPPAERVVSGSPQDGIGVNLSLYSLVDLDLDVDLDLNYHCMNLRKLDVYQTEVRFNRCPSPRLGPSPRPRGGRGLS